PPSKTSRESDKGNTKMDQQNQELHHILTLSAKSKYSLCELATRVEQYLLTWSSPAAHQLNYYFNQTESVITGELCLAFNTGRTHFNKYRLMMIAKSTKEMYSLLHDFRATTLKDSDSIDDTQIIGDLNEGEHLLINSLS